jgi:hypothetical protein
MPLGDQWMPPSERLEHFATEAFSVVDRAKAIVNCWHLDGSRSESLGLLYLEARAVGAEWRCVDVELGHVWESEVAS